MREIKFRAYNKKNITGTYIEANRLLTIAVYKLIAVIGSKRYVQLHNKEVRKLQEWRKDFKEVIK